MDPKLQELSTQGHGFAVFPEARIFDNPGGKSIEHLIFGDFISPGRDAAGAVLVWGDNSVRELAGEKWLAVTSRGESGWIKFDDIQAKRVLEVNFVDIGQGDGCHIVTPTDDHFVIDAGAGKNMYRFLNWRFNLRFPGAPLPKFHAVISHPDDDHYGGFGPLLANPPREQQKPLLFEKVYHSGIVQRPGSQLGNSATVNGRKYLTDLIDTHAKATALLSQPGQDSNYEKLLSGALAHNPAIRFEAASKDISEDHKILYDDGVVKLEILAPVTEHVLVNGVGQNALRWFASDVGKTKNGHSVVLMAHIGKMKILLGGDLNSKSADYLMSQYSGSDVEDIRKKLARADTPGEVAPLQTQMNEVVEKCKKTFQAEVAKSCHHGSDDITNEFLQSVNAIATVISSGDEESFCHPRPETLGAIGKYGRGERPLIFSTELARSTEEFITIRKNEHPTQDQILRTVAVYGMITLRIDGKQAIIAQKLEKKASRFGLITKWQMDKLIWNDERNEFISKK
jgi:beta-lactamase superfamily II metal-dependent hydrolase